MKSGFAASSIETRKCRARRDELTAVAECREVRRIANAPLPVSERARVALSRFPPPSAEGHGAPGGARALRYGALARPLRSGRVRAGETGLARPDPRRARPAMAGLRSPPPGRCASRRSTAARCRYRPCSSLKMPPEGSPRGAGWREDSAQSDPSQGLNRHEAEFVPTDQSAHAPQSSFSPSDLTTGAQSATSAASTRRKSSGSDSGVASKPMSIISC